MSGLSGFGSGSGGSSGSGGPFDAFAPQGGTDTGSVPMASPAVAPAADAGTLTPPAAPPSPDASASASAVPSGGSYTPTPPQPPQPPTLNNAMDDTTLARYRKANGPVGGGKFDNVPLPASEASPSADPDGDTLTLYHQNQAQYAAQATAAAGSGNAPMDLGATDYSAFWRGLKELPRGVGQGIAGTLGLPADLVNTVSDLAATHPHATGRLENLIGLGPDETALAGMPSYDPNAKGFHVSLGTEDIDAAVKYATGLDLHQQNRDGFSNDLYNVGQFIGYGLGGGALGAGGAAVGALREGAGLGAAALRGAAGAIPRRWCCRRRCAPALVSALC